MTSAARLRLPSTWGSQCRSIPKASASSFLTKGSGSNSRPRNIFRARFIILTLVPCRVRYSERVRKPMGYISKTDDEGMTSLTGPEKTGCSLKLNTLGGWRISGRAWA